MKLTSYNEKRKQFYSDYPHFFYDFPDLEYALYDVKELSSSVIKELNYATEILWKIHFKIGKFIQRLDSDQLLSLGIREEILPYVDLDYLGQTSVLSRFDFICMENNSIKMIELNADTPFLLQETFEMNEAVCRHFGKQNINDSETLQLALSKAFLMAFDYLGNKSSLKVVITGKEASEDIEEYCNVQFLKNIIPFAEYVPINELIICSEDTPYRSRGLYTGDMERIDVLYRPAHPIEFLLDDVSNDGDRIGIQLLDLVKDRKLAIINPPSSYILQSKKLMWIIWKCKDDPSIFTEEEMDAIQKYMLPTYLSEEPFKENGVAYVKKPVFSREGNTVEIYNARGQKVTTSNYRHYEDNLFIYQQYVEMPDIQIKLKDGLYKKKWLIGSFVADNKAVGLACRVGNQITEWDSHWLAVCSSDNKI